MKSPHHIAWGDAASTLAPRTSVVLVPGPSLGGPADLGDDLIRVLIDADRRGLETVALAGTLADLDAAPVVLARRLATDDPGVAAEADARLGEHRVLRIASLRRDDVHEWIGRVPVPESLRARRRLRSALGRIAPLRRLYERITNR